MTAITYPKEQVPMLVYEEKKATLRKPTFKINVKQSLKFLNNFKYGVFAEATGVSAELISVDDITDELAHDLGYSSKEEYLSHGWNDEYDSRLLIRWENISVNWDVIEKLGVI